jgi:hypothetical protein
MEKLMSPEDVGKVHSIENLPENDPPSVALGTIADEEQEARRALRKADMRILPLLTVLYVFSFMGIVECYQVNVETKANLQVIRSLEYREC